MSARLLLVRHGESVWQAEGRYSGVTDIALDEHGERQARELAVWAARRRPDALACSPLSRAVHTAQPAADALGLDLRLVPELREVDFGWGEGRTTAEMLAERPEVVEAFWANADTGPLPGAEPLADAAHRAVSALRHLAEAWSGATVLVVAHNSVLRIALCALLDIPLGRYRLVFPILDNAAVSEIEMDGERTAMISLNVPTGEPACGTER